MYNIQKKGGFMELSGNLLMLPEKLFFALSDELLEELLDVSDLFMNYLISIYDFYKRKSDLFSDACLESHCMQFIVRYIIYYDKLFRNTDVRTIFKLSDEEIKILRSKYGIISHKECENVAFYKMDNIINKLGRWLIKDINPRVKKLLFFKSHKGEQSIMVLSPYLDEKFIKILIKNGIDTLQKLLNQTTLDVSHINGIGVNNYRMIIDAVHCFERKTSLNCRFKDEQFGINNISDGEVTKDHTLNYLGLPFEIYNILTGYILNKKIKLLHDNSFETQVKLVTINDLISLTTNEVIKIPKIGTPRFELISNKIHSLGFMFADESLNLTDEIILTDDMLAGKETIINYSMLKKILKICMKKIYKNKIQTNCLVSAQDYSFSTDAEFNCGLYSFDCKIVNFQEPKDSDDHRIKK